MGRGCDDDDDEVEDDDDDENAVFSVTRRYRSDVR